ncbi:hypothetical protein BM536_004875 [Streptomyces phaeoluteigriseus]|uniref:PPM-type phosphatase domain-containing protein n=1 Tax=Streptomyces phaeoluteigriseus TaxID=114686 RepID=A0A1V6MXY4_9ACTN|nr:SpoIIE family protein phosphatase [Streptomyces phaeoluteigriseus]OQD57319.1 hypothetical protein BM536_004875 [Streptomyces phaeoluteigriseus]
MIIPGAGTVTICSAGHLPVLVVGTGQGVRALDCPVNMPLGVGVGIGDVPLERARAKTPPGATLVLYKDGLIETPGSDMELGIAELTVPLRQLFADAPRLEKAVDRMLAGAAGSGESQRRRDPPAGTAPGGVGLRTRRAARAPRPTARSAAVGRGRTTGFRPGR